MRRRSFISIAGLARFLPASQTEPWGAPRIRGARGEHRRVVLSFTPVEGAVSYDVRCDPGGTMQGVLATDYTIHGLENGNAYRFQVAAVGPRGTTPFSAPATATPTAEMSWEALREAFQGDNPTRSSCPFWMLHGNESDEELRRFLDIAYQFGFEGVTLHPYDLDEYLGEGQWRRWQVIVDHARKLGLAVWQQDDRDYPSGYAGGTIGAREPRLARWEVALPHSRAVSGPAALEVDLHSVLPAQQTAIAVCAFGPEFQVRDLTGNISSGRLAWQVPEGNWEIFIATEWQPGISDPRASPDHKKGQDRRYIDPLSERATDLYVEAIQGATLRRLGSEFGKIWKGFYIDEPSFGASGTRLGTPGVGYPWTPDFFARFEVRFGYSLRPLLPLLWVARHPKTRQVRYDYMEFVSGEYGRLFIGKQTKFAEAHGIQIIGHVIELLEFEYGLGKGTGSTQRTLEHFSMGGFDSIFDQWYGLDEDVYWRQPKMASSVSHYNQTPLDEAMVEHFAATGWRTGLTEMKAMMDWTTCRGMNRIVPCGLDTQDPPVWEDAPEFWLHGKNPLARYFRDYQVVANRETMMIRGGLHVAKALILDPAESAWTGRNEDLWKANRALSQAHFDYDDVTYRVFADRARCHIENGKILLGREDYEVVVLPGVDAVPLAVLQKLMEFRDAGGTVILLAGGIRFTPRTNEICPRLPARSTDGRHDAEVKALAEKLWLDPAPAHGRALMVAYKDATNTLYSLDLHDVWIDPNLIGLQYYHRVLSGRNAYFFNNEGEAVRTEVRLRGARGVPEFWDPVTGRIRQAECYTEDGAWLRVLLTLDRYQSVFVVVDPSAGSQSHLTTTDADEAWRMSGDAIELRKYGPGPVQYRLVRAGGAVEEKVLPAPPGDLRPLRLREDWSRTPGAANSASYAVRFEWEPAAGTGAELRIGDMTQHIAVCLNGSNLGARFAYPFRFEMSAALRAGSNLLEIQHTERNTFESKLGTVDVVPFHRYRI